MKEMTSDFSVTLTTDRDAVAVFDAINNVRAWWIDEIDGNTQSVSDEFSVRFGDIHYSKQRIIESIPGVRIVWLVTESHLSFVDQPSEWTGTKIVFTIESQSKGTKIVFTHVGLSSAIQCFDECSDAWSGYIKKSLHALIMTGKGKPTMAQSLKSA